MTNRYNPTSNIASEYFDEVYKAEQHQTACHEQIYHNDYYKQMIIG